MHPRKPIGRTAGAIATVAVLLLASCASTGQPGTTGTEATPSTSATEPASSATEPVPPETVAPPTSETTTTEPTTTSTEPSSAGGGPAEIIVTLADLPSTWSELTSSVDSSPGSCIDSATVTGDVLGPDSPADSLTASFSQSNLGPFLVAMVATGVDNPDTSFDALVDAITACNATTDSSGLTTSIEPVSVPAVGAESFAVRADLSNQSGTAVRYFLEVARVGDTIVLVSNVISLGELDESLVQEMVRTMAGRA